MTLEHVRDPAELARSAFWLLRPGGAFVAITHDYRGALNRLLGSRSPIIDIEHVQLFSRPSLRRMLEDSGLEDISIRAFRNRYALRYWLRLAPLPPAARMWILKTLDIGGLAGAKLGFNVGNLMGAGFKR
jgi:hypothetical protein